MEQPFSDQLKQLANNMGIALYQRFSQVEAALFLRCPITELQKLQTKRKIEYIQVTNNQSEFFGYQLVDYILNSIQGKLTPEPKSNGVERIINAKEVQRLTGLSRTSIWRQENAGKFPARVALSTSRVGWLLSEVQLWIKSC